jgi:hypothetical protein
MADRDAVDVALAVSRALEGLGIKYSIGGSLASTVAGEPRSTIDVDIVASIDDAQVPALVSALEGEFHVDELALRRAVRERRSTNLVHRETLWKVDIFVAGGSPLDRLQIERRQAVSVDGRTIHVHSPEDILLQKLLWYRKGGEVSDRQWRDILGIVRVQGARLDLEYVKRHADSVGVLDLLARARSEGAMR